LGGCAYGYDGGGGGLDIIETRATIKGNLFVDNFGSPDGGAVYLFYSDSILSGNTFIENIASGPDGGGGGGIYLFRSSAKILNNQFQGNIADWGGAVALQTSAATLANNEIISNTSLISDWGGGGVAMVDSYGVLIRDNYVANNNTNGSGGGLWSWLSNGRYINNVFSDNMGGGLFFDQASGKMFHNTLARNQSGIILHEDSSVVLTNTILVSHTIGVEVISDTSKAFLESTLWGSGVWANQIDWVGDGNIITGTLNILGDPKFHDPDSGDYHIDFDSAAKDAGLDVGVGWDIDGQLRPMGNHYDIGADEYPGVGLYLDRLFPGDFQNRGEIMTHLIVVTNTEYGIATDVVLTGSLDNWQRPLAVVPSFGSCDPVSGDWGESVFCKLGDLVPSGSATITLTAEVSASTPVGKIITSRVLC
jgi:hypothetical protein